MPEINDLPTFSDVVANDDLLVARNVSKTSNHTEKLSITKLRTDAFLGVALTWTAAQTLGGGAVAVAPGAAAHALTVKAAASPSASVLEVVNSSDVARHELWAEYGTNIPAVRTMAGYQEFSVQPGNITTQTLTVDVVGGTFAHQPVMMEVVGTFRNNSDGNATRAEWVDDVLWRTRADSATPATIDANTRRISDINAVTVTGPTAINGGVRYTVKSTSGNLVRAGMMLRVFTPSTVTVTASVA